MEYISEIISAVLGFLAGITATIVYQKISIKENSDNNENFNNPDNSYTNAQQTDIKTGGGDFAGRDMFKNTDKPQNK
ncbi:hypothetical protein EAH57_00085 [Acinetobacter sp. 2JN-4]|uniref:hypothetical protein n=1 Tax=Acinetobacter sp. 2JN-4 TaxID=2479844 RepID=UPI000EF9B339|nr:hypothetical protein [Acinetobacter sp. 2JN-4]RLZ10824.1 hypothetical protein EAH57_00085 [Acinetobacter sp. 2JN-4]